MNLLNFKWMLSCTSSQNLAAARLALYYNNSLDPEVTDAAPLHECMVTVFVVMLVANKTCLNLDACVLGQGC